MTEQDAIEWLRSEFDVSRGTLDRLAAFADLVRSEGEKQNLISRITFGQIWSRHIMDSAQLVRLVPNTAGTWLDLGTGAGFPGLVVAALHPARVICVESRPLRVNFLRRAADLLGVSGRTEIVERRIELVPDFKADVISARAFAPLERLLVLAERFGSPATHWVLPKGRNARTELEAVRASWQGEYELAPSLTDPDAQIIVARDVRRRGKGRT